MQKNDFSKIIYPGIAKLSQFWFVDNKGWALRADVDLPDDFFRNFIRVINSSSKVGSRHQEK